MSKDTLTKLYVYGAVFVTGAVVLVIEILGTRVLAPFYGSTIFVWSSLITVTLSALAFGYWGGGRFADRYPSPVTLLIGIALAAVSVVLPMKIDQWVLPMTDILGVEWGALVASFILFAPPLFLLGTAGPMAIRLRADSVEHAGSVAGAILAVGTAGSIVGAFLAGFLLLPRFSLTDIFNASALLLFFVAAIGFFLFRASVRDASTSIGVLVLIVGTVYATPKYLYTDHYTYRVYDQVQSRYGDLKVMSVGGSYCLALNGFTQSCSDQNSGAAAFGNIEEMVGPVTEKVASSGVRAEPPRGLLLGMGSGDIARALPSRTELDVVEIDPQIVALAEEYFNFVPSSSQHVVVADGRNYLRETEQTYDFILFDAYAGGQIPSHLLTREAIELYEKRLKPSGVLIMNIETRPSADNLVYTSVLRTVASVFPSVAAAAPYPDEEGYLQSVVVYASPTAYTPPHTAWYRPLPIDGALLSRGEMLSDEYFPIDTAVAADATLFRDKMKSFGGYQPFFTL